MEQQFLERFATPSSFVVLFRQNRHVSNDEISPALFIIEDYSNSHERSIKTKKESESVAYPSVRENFTVASQFS